MMRIRQMQCDVNVREEAELRRLENGSQVGGDVMMPQVSWTESCGRSDG